MEDGDDSALSGGETSEDLEEILDEEAFLDAAVYASGQEETLQLTVKPSELESGTLTLTHGAMSFAFDPAISGTTVEQPVLEIRIPDIMQVTRYLDDKLNNDCMATPNASDSITMTTEGGYTVLTYRFKSKKAWVNFGIEAQIADGYQIKNGQKYSIIAKYYDGTQRLKTKTVSFTTVNHTVQVDYLSLDSFANYSTYLEPDQTQYDVESSYLRRTINSTNYYHYPFDSITLTSPLPPGAVPYMYDRDSAAYTKKMPKGQPIQHRWNDSEYTVTYNGSALVYKLTSGDFLSHGSSFTFYSDDIILRYTSPAAKTYTASASDTIECVVDGKTFRIPSDYKCSVTFMNHPDVTVDPYTNWESTITLKPDETTYDTTEFYRYIRFSTSRHRSFDAAEMTVPLPEGAVPGFGTGSSFTPLSKNVAQKIGNSYGTWTVTYTGSALIYRLEKESYGDFLSSGYLFHFSESSSKKIYLRFTDPTPGTYRADSPTIKCFAKGKEVLSFTASSPDYADYPTVVTVYEPPKDSGLYPDFDADVPEAAEPKEVGWNDTILLEDGKTVYDTKIYDRAIYSSEEKHFYPYENVKMTVLLPDEAIPGVGSGAAFVPLQDGKKEAMSSTWAVTYYESYPYKSGTDENDSAESDAPVKTARALVYEILPGADFLTSGKSFSFTTSSRNLYLRFEDQTSAAMYASAGSPNVTYVMNGTIYISKYPFKPTQTDTSVTFKERSVQWTELKVASSTNTTPYTRDNSCVLPKEYQSDKEYKGYITNQTGVALQNITVKYTFDQKLYADRLTFHLGESGYPSTAQVAYTTSLHPEETNVTLSSGSSVLALEEGDALLTAVVTYDSLENAAAAKEVMTANIHNFERLQDAGTPRKVTAAIQSADCDRDNGESEKKFGPSASTSFKLTSTLETLSAASKTLDEKAQAPVTALDKGDAFTVRVHTSSVSYSDQNRYQNLSLYLRMPKGYLLTGYEPPSGTDRDGYVADSRVLENGDILYRVEYTDQVLYTGGNHDFKFKVGPEADTFERSDIPLPTAAYASVGEGTLFQFPASKMRSEQNIGLDVNGDGDMDDRFYPLNTTTIEIRPFGDMSAEGYLTSTDQVGEDTSSKYNFFSDGSYRFYLYNGVASGAVVSGAEIVITLPRAGHEFTYKEETYTAKWDALLTAPITLTGAFLEGAEVFYSTEWEADTWLTADQIETEPEKLKRVLRIRVKTAADKQLSKAESAILDIPFAADFLSGDMKEDGAVYPAFIGAHMTYQISTAVDDETQTADLLSTLEAAPLEFSGTVFHDKNGNWIQDENEFTGNARSLFLYSGEGTDGELLQEISTAANGRYTCPILLPGIYTLHAEKEEAELYEYKTSVFDENGNYVIRLSADEKPQTKNLDLGLVAPRALEANTDPVTLLNGMTHRPGYTLTPILSAWERDQGKTVSFESSDPSVVTADKDGLLRFAGEGRATVTITAPQLEAVLELRPETPESLTAEVPIVTELPPPVFTVYPEKPDGDNGWYVTKPLVTLLPGTTADYVTTWFRDQEDTADTYREQTPEHRPTIKASGLYSFIAYNTAPVASDPNAEPAQSKTASLETLKIDLIPPTISTERTTFSPTGVDLLSDIGRFLTFGNFFKEAIRVTVHAQDMESGVGTLYYILPGQEVQSASIGRDGSGYFDVPLDTNGRVIYYVSDKAGNLSDEIVLQKDEGPDLWVIEDRPPVWEPFDMTDENGTPGVQGADGNLWFAGTAEVTAHVSDEDSGLAAVSVQIDEGIPEIVHFGILSPVASIRVVASARADIAARAAADEPTTTDTRQYDYMLKTTVEAEGLHILYAEAEDNAKNVSFAETALGIDRTAPALTLENSNLSGDTPYASVLITDLGSGVDPETILITWREQTIAGTVEVADGGYRVSFQLPAVSPGDTDNLLQVAAADHVGHKNRISVECPVKQTPVDPGPLDQVPKTGETSASESNTMRLDRTEALTATRKKDEQDGEDEGLRQA